MGIEEVGRYFLGQAFPALAQPPSPSYRSGSPPPGGLAGRVAGEAWPIRIDQELRNLGPPPLPVGPRATSRAPKPLDRTWATRSTAPTGSFDRGRLARPHRRAASIAVLGGELQWMSCKFQENR